MTKCACGRPLHYKDVKLKKLIERINKRCGGDVILQIFGVFYTVQRHYVALHGIDPLEIEELEAKGIVRKVKSS